MTPYVVAIVQARMASSRLPGKVMQPIEGLPMLVRVIERARRAQTLDAVLVATTDQAGDHVLETLCLELGYPVLRGHPSDVLDRYLHAAEAFHAEVVVRLTADCPLIDPGVIDKTVSAFLDARPRVDYASNRLVRTYPIGLDVEVMTMDALARAGREADQPYQREHVTPYFYEEPGRFKTLPVESGGDYGALRWTVDTEQDLAFVRQVYARFEGRADFDWQEVLELLAAEPELAAINAEVRQKGFREAE